MGKTTLGLDLGPTSIGWALVDEDGSRIIASGVRVFPEGVDRDNRGGEKSKNETRRTARSARRTTARRARRKSQLRALLAASDLLPNQEDELDALLRLDPYLLRHRGLTEALSPHEFGRALFHLSQRRGFKLNRKTSTAKKTEERGMLGEINALAHDMEEAGHETLGEHLALLRAEPHVRVRGRHTRRDMYEEEFDLLWERQQRHHASLLTDVLREQARRIVFFQRDMYWPKSAIGRCDLEPKERRCGRADRLAQRFRLLQEVNNLRLIDTRTGEFRPLTKEERAALVAYLSKAKSRTFNQIRKKLGFDESVRFNLEAGDRKSMKGMETDALLAAKRAFGKEWWQRPDDERDAIVELLQGLEDDEDVLAQLRGRWKLPPENAEVVLSASLPSGHMSVSRLAIEKLLPHLEEGLPLMADDDSACAMQAAGYLRPDQRVVGQRDDLPPPPSLTNPIVRQALSELRKVVNALIREYGKPDRIQVELARETKQSFAQREQASKIMARRRRERREAKERIEELGYKPTRATINRYLLWEEQGRACAYSFPPRTISLAQLFGGEVDVDHILPYGRSLDDSLMNKVVCFRAENAEKRDQTPAEWLRETEPERFQQILRCTNTLPYPKRQRFIRDDIVLDDFIERQLRDTAYISRSVLKYMRCLGADVVCTRGQLTSELRHRWDLNTILAPEGGGRKSRDDHRHHAVDAITIALTSRSRLQALAKAGKGWAETGRGQLAAPWSGFRDDVAASVADIIVSHRVNRRISGALHEDTIYGPTAKGGAHGEDERPWAKNWIENEKTYVRRKPLTALTSPKHLQKVRDPTIRAILAEHLRTNGVDPATATKIPPAVWSETPQMPSGVPIRRVRMLEGSPTMRRLQEKSGARFVRPGNNHHIVYGCNKGGPDARWSAHVVPTWDALQRAQRGLSPVDRSDVDGQPFLMSLSVNESFLITVPDGSTALCVVRKLTQRDRTLFYKRHTDARSADRLADEKQYASPKRMKELQARKVTVDPLGRVRWASD